MGGRTGASLVKVPVNKGMLLNEVRVATVRKCKSNVKGVCIMNIFICHLQVKKKKLVENHQDIHSMLMCTMIKTKRSVFVSRMEQVFSNEI